jgi:hypothetical protein
MAMNRLPTILCQVFPLPIIPSFPRYGDERVSKHVFKNAVFLYLVLTQSAFVQVNSSGFESIHRMSSEPSSMVKLPPASPFDNFLKAAYRTQPEL